MENNSKENNICFDQIEKIMQELDATNRESNSSTPPPMDLPHRPIILEPQIKEEPKDKDAHYTHFETPVVAHQDNATSNNVVSTVPTQISDNGSNFFSNTPGQLTQVQIKKERVEDDVEMSIGIPSKHYDRNDSAIHNTQPTTMDSTPLIKSEPADTHSVATEANPLQNVLAKVATPTNSTNNNSQEVPTETNMDSTAPNSPSGIPEPDETLPDNFFDDLIKDVDNITAAALKSTAPHEKAHTQVFLNVKREPVDTTTFPEATTSAAPNNTTQENEHTQVNLNVKNEPVDTTAIPETTTSAPIPENFFDDLLVDHVAERVDEVVNNDLELKYSERLKELEQLQAKEQESHKTHKKHKKKKKKSHKRTHGEINENEDSIITNHKRSKRALRSHSKSPPTRRDSEAQIRSTNKSPIKRIRVKSEFTGSEDRPIEIVDLYSEEPETSAAAASRMVRVKSEFSTYQPYEKTSEICLPVKEKELFQSRSNINRNGLIIDMTAPLGFKRIKMESDLLEKSKTAEYILPKDKIENAKQRAIAAIEDFNKWSKKPKDPAFIYTNTVRKLPNSSTYITQQIYDNRSPLHNVNNVLYKFNSHANEFNLHEWGIEEMPPKAREVAKILGFDVDALDKRKETIKLPPKIQKIKKEHIAQTEKKLTHTQTSFLITVSTQTDEVTVLDANAKHRHNIAVQTESQGNTNGMSTCGNNYEDLPLMRQIRTFNENQLMALSGFADLICESALEPNAVDLCLLHQRMIKIYRFAQMPSELEQNDQQPSTQVLRDPRQARKSQESPPPPPAPRLLPQFAQAPKPPTMNQHLRDPRQERILTMSEPLPPSWPTAHTVAQQHYQRQQQTTWPIPQRPERPAAVAQKIPLHLPHTMVPQQSYAPKYYGRGAMRR
ncbi:uncharacterized protein LOC105219120 [Zeugodacus cucurbitae]|uniref:uncharacterized protein LOC105219120 n=1 Tax=Zeugodacus cucurbitae TaxID=28588 RepID=UPI0023D95D76|nr:uncharacterized protein LOC105219120 [Zeugodacus cucurbitae]